MCSCLSSSFTRLGFFGRLSSGKEVRDLSRTNRKGGVIRRLCPAGAGINLSDRVREV